MINQLRKFGVKRITSLQQGSKLLSSDTLLEHDLLIIGYELGNSHNGVEFMRALDPLLPIWCKFVFVTNFVSVVSESYPFRFIHTEVMEKPIHPMTLKKLIAQGILSINALKEALLALEKSEFPKVLKLLDGISTERLLPNQKDEITTLKMVTLLRLGRGEECWSLGNDIKEDILRFSNKLNVARTMGDERKLAITEKFSQTNPILKRRLLFNSIQRAINKDDPESALKLVEQIPEHTLTPSEIDLKVILMVQVKGLDLSIEYLTTKLGTTLENVYFRNAVTFSMVKCYLWVMITDLTFMRDVPEMFEAFSFLLKNNSWERGGFDFTQYIPYLELIKDAYTGHNQEVVKAELHAAIQSLSTLDCFKVLMLCMAAYLAGRTESTRGLFVMADRLLVKADVSPEQVSNEMFYKALFKSVFTQSERAREYNRIGIEHAKSALPYRAMRKFYLSHINAQDNAAFAINLLDFMLKQQLKGYWDVAVPDLVASISGMKLRENEEKKMSVLLKRIKKA